MSLSRVQLFATPWTVARQAPLSMASSRHPTPQVYIAHSGKAEASELLNLKLIPYGCRQDAHD